MTPQNVSLIRLSYGLCLVGLLENDEFDLKLEQYLKEQGLAMVDTRGINSP